MTTIFTDEKEICDFINECKIAALAFNEMEKEVLRDIDEIWEESMQKKPRYKMLKQLASLRGHITTMRHEMSKLSTFARLILDKYNAFEEDG